MSEFRQYITNADFLKKLDNNRYKKTYAKIIVLDKDERPLSEIQGRVQPGSSISVNGNSALRRTCNISFVAEHEENDLTNVDNLLSINKRIKILIGVENDIDPDYDKIIWFPQGIFIINQPTITHSLSHTSIALNCKDKMCLLNGESGGSFPTSITFHEYDQIINGEVHTMPQLIYDIIQTVVCRWGNEDISNIEINDVPLRIKQILRYTGSDLLYYNVNTGVYTTNYDKVKLAKKLQGIDGDYFLDCYKINKDDNTMGTLYFDDVTYKYQKLNEEEALFCYGKYNGKFYPFLMSKVSDDAVKYRVSVNGEPFVDESLDIGVCKDDKGNTWYYTKIINTTHGLVAAEDEEHRVGASNMIRLKTNLTNDTQTVNQLKIDATDQAAADKNKSSEGSWRHFSYNDEVGYCYTDFIFPGELVSNIGENVCSVLDKIVSVLGNFEYFYDVNGKFVFQEKRNYLNKTYDITNPSYLANANRVFDGSSAFMSLENNNLSIINENNFEVSYVNNSKSIYTFDNANLISAYSNSPNYSNIKNDFHFWGKSEGANAIHYHLAIKEKPQKPYAPHYVEFDKDAKGNYTGRVKLITSTRVDGDALSVQNNRLIIPSTREGYETHHLFDDIYKLKISEQPQPDVKYNQFTGQSTLLLDDIEKENLDKAYVATDWRAELYLQALEKQAAQIRPDIYEQELLDNFDSIYDFHTPIEYDSNHNVTKRGAFKTDMVNKPNALSYFLDFIEPTNGLEDFSSEVIGNRIYSYQQDKIKTLFTSEIPNKIIVNIDSENYNKVLNEAIEKGDTTSQVDGALYSTLAESTYGYAADETARDTLYQYTTYNQSISLTTIPIYYLEPNTRITVEDKETGISGDYIISSFNIALDGNSMSISATKAMDRI